MAENRSFMISAVAREDSRAEHARQGTAAMALTSMSHVASVMSMTMGFAKAIGSPLA